MSTPRAPRAPSREYAATGRAEFGPPPVVLHNDDALVAACLARGGFPVAVRLKVGRTVWAGPDGRYWRGWDLNRPASGAALAARRGRR